MRELLRRNNNIVENNNMSYLYLLIVYIVCSYKCQIVMSQQYDK